MSNEVQIGMQTQHTRNETADVIWASEVVQGGNLSQNRYYQFMEN